MLGATAAGEFLVYDSYFSSSGSHPFTFRIATMGSGSQIAVYVDGVLMTTTSLPDTGSYSTFQSVSSAPVSVASGSHLIKLVLDQSFAFDYFEV